MFAALAKNIKDPEPTIAKAPVLNERKENSNPESTLKENNAAVAELKNNNFQLVPLEANFEDDPNDTESFLAMIEKIEKENAALMEKEKKDENNPSTSSAVQPNETNQSIVNINESRPIVQNVNRMPFPQCSSQIQM